MQKQGSTITLTSPSSRVCKSQGVIGLLSQNSEAWPLGYHACCFIGLSPSLVGQALAFDTLIQGLLPRHSDPGAPLAVSGESAGVVTRQRAFKKRAPHVQSLQGIDLLVVQPISAVNAPSLLIIAAASDYLTACIVNCSAALCPCCT